MPHLYIKLVRLGHWKIVVLLTVLAKLPFSGKEEGSEIVDTPRPPSTKPLPPLAKLHFSDYGRHTTLHYTTATFFYLAEVVM